MQTKDKALLQKIFDEIEVIEIVVSETDTTTFEVDKIRQHAAVMALLNIGELSRNLDDPVRKMAPEIPWKQIIGLRNVAAHGYASLEMPDIWKTITEDIPNLKRSLKQLLKEL
jgi:uncharacterized protein with HEPN domain